jgi:hypothetical protein
MRRLLPLEHEQVGLSACLRELGRSVSVEQAGADLAVVAERGTASLSFRSSVARVARSVSLADR